MGSFNEYYANWNVAMVKDAAGLYLARQTWKALIDWRHTQLVLDIVALKSQKKVVAVLHIFVTEP